MVTSELDKRTKTWQLKSCDKTAEVKFMIGAVGVEIWCQVIYKLDLRNEPAWVEIRFHTIFGLVFICFFIFCEQTDFIQLIHITRCPYTL